MRPIEPKYLLILAFLIVVSYYRTTMYSFTFILVCVCLISNAFSQPRDQLDRPTLPDKYATGKLVGFLEDLKDKMKTGDDKLGIPVLDPFESIQESLNFKKEGLGEVTALLTNIHAEGLSNFIVHEGDFTVIGLKIRLALEWPEISATTKYIANGVIGDNVNVFGNGDIVVTAKDLYFATDVGLSVRDKKLYIKSIGSELSLGSLDLKITGLFNDEEVSALFSSIISDLAPGVIKDYQAEVIKVVDEIIAEQANEFLKDKTLKDILDMIG